jgi:hypothetical protein
MAVLAVAVVFVACTAPEMPTIAPSPTPTFTTTVQGRTVAVTDRSGWLSGVADASDHRFPDSLPTKGIVQGPMAHQLFVRLDFCSLTTTIAIRDTEEVFRIEVDDSFPWPSGEAPPACPDVMGTVLLTFDRDVSPPPSPTQPS